ncbi:MAG: hypothetical protein KF794_10855 [Xanthobacteraceae bacterium]|nr:hypothetical protein [Xanthobacteraceae bacterium]QYK44281.1 MAG: hypothetical protein KF794_10855 [Xanthobacteraceae bacterium]
MTSDLIRYDLLAQDALRGVVRKVLSDVAKDGLPGDHHFFIAFDTRAQGLRISERLRQKFPEEMTIVLQHQFWDLKVGEHAFEVGVSFNGAPERLLIPFTAVKGFFDPSVQFGLQFEVAGDEKAQSSPAQLAVSGGEKPGEKPLASAPKGAASEPEVVKPAKEAKAAEPSADSAGAEVVSLDKFRKK